MAGSHQLKTCRTCHEQKPVSEFYSDPGKRFGVSGQCKECCKRLRRENYAADPQTILDRNKRWQDSNPDWVANHYAALKKEAFDRYGGHCVCCGEGRRVFLCFDHINDDGAEHRKKDPSAYQIILWLRRNHYPEEVVQILCMNCNWAKYAGGCPHQEELD